MSRLVLKADSAEAMLALGKALGRELEVGDVLSLVGPLGSGKTTFAQGLAQGLDIPPERHVTSPTFALVNEHPGRVAFVHADLYRLENEDELDELGLEEAMDRAVVAIEWAERFPQVLPADHIRVAILTAADGTREVEFSSAGPGAGVRIAALSSVLGRST
jgi:tRNA threonylcarbamoyladenosine biosynthesis protein TsaE